MEQSAESCILRQGVYRKRIEGEDWCTLDTVKGLPLDCCYIQDDRFKEMCKNGDGYKGCSLPREEIYDRVSI